MKDISKKTNKRIYTYCITKIIKKKSIKERNLFKNVLLKNKLRVKEIEQKILCKTI